MQITHDVIAAGARGEESIAAVIDTGAEVSVIPWKLAYAGVNGAPRSLPLVEVMLEIPSLKTGRRRWPLVGHPDHPDLIIGLDVMKPLGISIHTKTHVLVQRNEAWEAFKSFAGAGVILYGGARLLDVLSLDDAEVPAKRTKKKATKMRSRAQ